MCEDDCLDAAARGTQLLGDGAVRFDRFATHELNAAAKVDGSLPRTEATLCESWGCL